MKAITLILAVACAVSFSSCCCQKQSMPKLRPMPKFKPTDSFVPGQGQGQGDQPVMVMPSGKSSK